MTRSLSQLAGDCRRFSANVRAATGAGVVRASRFFDNVVGLYEPAGSLIRTRLRRVDQQTTTIEHVLDGLASEARSSKTLRRELMALRLYLRDVLWTCGDTWAELAPGQTNYHVLMRELCAWQESSEAPISLVSFNYDPMLDKALGSFPGRRLDQIDDYVADPMLRLFKPAARGRSPARTRAWLARRSAGRRARRRARHHSSARAPPGCPSSARHR